MSITGNRGEWSEIYVFLKLLGEGIIHAGDADMNVVSDVIYPVIKIIREEESHIDYTPDIDRSLVFIDESGNRISEIPMQRFLQESRYLLNNIKTNNGTFSVDTTESFMHEIKCKHLKAPSKDKSDITIVIHDAMTGRNPQLGFSIKSKLGSASTLLNASRATNFTFRITGALSEEKIAEINAIDSQKGRMSALSESGCRLEFAFADSEIFNSNLMLVDTAMPTIIANALLAFFSCDCKSVKAATEHIIATNPVGVKTSDLKTFYEHKMKNLLVDVALGMKPTTLWSGRYEANGGYLVVKEDGDVICYHFYLRNELESYLFNNTKFEQASRKRHGYGDIVRADDGKLYMKLNLQIRFE